MLFRTPAPVFQAGSADNGHLACLPLTHPTLHYPMSDHFLTLGWLHLFFDNASLIAEFSNMVPDSSFFRQMFSSSRAFSRLTYEASLPPYFDFQP